jgi:preprotein translocase subunit SecE
VNKILTYFKDSYRELVEKVSWPTFAQLQQTTMIVIGATLFITAVVYVMDFVLIGKAGGTSVGILNFFYKIF